MSLSPVFPIPRYLCAVHTSRHSQSKCFPTCLTNVYPCFTSPNPWKIEMTSLWCPPYLEISLSNSSLVLFLSLQQLLTETREWRFITACIIMSCFGIFFCRDKTFPNFPLWKENFPGLVIFKSKIIWKVWVKFHKWLLNEGRMRSIGNLVRSQDMILLPQTSTTMFPKSSQRI